MDHGDDVPMTDDGQHDEHASHLPLSNDEQRVLDLYDQLQQLRLEIAMINAQTSHQSSRNDSESYTISEQTQKDLLEARANYKLRNDAIASVMSANPILKAVHNGTNATAAERDLLPYVERRDQVAKSVAKRATDQAFLRGDLVEVQSVSARVIRKNVELTAALFELADEVKEKQAAQLDDEETQREIAGLERDMKSSRQRWRVIKGVASGVVAGSGVDWARDAKLQDIVLDLESED